MQGHSFYVQLGLINRDHLANLFALYLDIFLFLSIIHVKILNGIERQFKQK